jgi:Uma2 family endonuclease
VTAETLARPTTARPEADWANPPDPDLGWTFDQVKDLDVPFEFDLVDGAIVPRGMTGQWHDTVRDGLLIALRTARPAPYGVNSERCVMLDDHNTPKPDVVVFDRTGLDIFTLECVPVASVALAVEVVSPGSRSDDRYRKPGQYAEAGIQHYWRVERDTDQLPAIHEFYLDRDSGVYAPAPRVSVHRQVMRTDFPFPVEIDLKGLLEV